MALPGFGNVSLVVPWLIHNRHAKILSHQERFWFPHKFHFGLKHAVLGRKLTFLVSLAIYIDHALTMHMIAQIDALDETKNYAIKKDFAQ